MFFGARETGLLDLAVQQANLRRRMRLEDDVLGDVLDKVLDIARPFLSCPCALCAVVSSNSTKTQLVDCACVRSMM